MSVEWSAAGIARSPVVHVVSGMGSPPCMAWAWGFVYILSRPWAHLLAWLGRGVLREPPLARACLRGDNDHLGWLAISLELTALVQGVRYAQRANSTDIDLKHLMDVVHMALAADADAFCRPVEVCGGKRRGHASEHMPLLVNTRV